MPLTDLKAFAISQYSLADSAHARCIGGTYYNGCVYAQGYDGEDTVYLAKADLVGNRLWELPFYSSTSWYFGNGYNGGGLLIHNGRIYYKNQIDHTVCWVPFSDPIVANQTPTKILDCSGGFAQDYHAYGDYERAWWGKIVKDEYIFHIEPGAHTILVTDLDGNFIGRFGEYGSLLGQFNTPVDVVYYPPNRIYVCELETHRITEWRVNSWENPFDIEPVVEYPDSVDDYYAHGMAYHYNQLFKFTHNTSSGRVQMEYIRINSDFSLIIEETEILYTTNSKYCSRGFVCFSSESKFIGFMGGTYGGPARALVGTITPLDNGMDSSFIFDIYAVISGVGIDIDFDLVSGSPQTLLDVPLEVSVEGYTQENTLDETFSFSALAEAGPYNMISEFGFELVAGEYGVRESFSFDLFAGQNHLEQTFGFEIYTETSTTEFSTLESSFVFELLAGAPCSGGLSLELETLELHSKAAADIIGICQFLLESLVAEAYEGPTSELVLPTLEVEASISVPSTGVSRLILSELSVVASASVPSVASMVLGLEGLSAEGQALIHGQLNGAVVLPSLVTQGIMSMGAASAQISAVINNLKVNSWGAIVPSITGALVLPSLTVSSSQSIQLYSISELYDGNSLIHIPGADYYQIDLSSFSDLEENLFDVQGLAINLGTKAITKLGHPSTYNVIDLGYLDVHKVAVMDYLIVYLYGDMPTEEDSVGQLVVGDYSYEIKRWITDGEWRVVIGKGLTKQSFRGPSVRYQRILLQLKDGFELKGITILATPNPRRLR